MAIQLGSTILETKLSMSYKSQYTSGQINQKSISLPRGIVRGFRAKPGVAAGTVDLMTDELLGDSVMNAIGILPSGVYSIVYRETAVVNFSVSGIGGTRVYVAFVPLFTTSAVTTGEYRGYTEAQFENGDIESEGGVFLFSAANVAGVIDPWDIFLAGESQGGSPKLFVQEFCDNFHSAHGPNEKSLVIDVVPEPTLSDFTGYVASDVSFSDAEFYESGGSVAITDSSLFYVGGTCPLWRDQLDDASQGGTIIVEAWYKTDGGYVGTDSEIDILFSHSGGSYLTSNAMNVAGQAHTYKKIPGAVQSTWKLLRYELKVPTNAMSGVTGVKQFRCEIDINMSAGTMYLGPIRVWLTHPRSSVPGNWSRSFRGGAKALVTPIVKFIDESMAQLGADTGWDAHTETLGNRLNFDYRGTSDSEFTIDAGSAARPLKVTTFGNGAIANSNRFLADQMPIETSMFVRTNAVRSRTGDLISVLNNAGADSAIIESNHLRIDGIRTKSGSDVTVFNSTAANRSGLRTAFHHFVSTDGEWGIAGAPLIDRQYRGNTVVAQGAFVGASPSVLGFLSDTEVFGVNAITITGAPSGVFRVDFINSMANTNYTVLVSSTITSSIATCTSRTVSGFSVTIQDHTGAAVDLAISNYSGSFIVLGRH